MKLDPHLLLLPYPVSNRTGVGVLDTDTEHRQEVIFALYCPVKAQPLWLGVFV
jgi:hypothetical protein